MNPLSIINRKFLFLIFVLLACKAPLPSQQVNSEEIKATTIVKGSVQDFAFDKLNQLYINTRQNEILKYGNINNLEFRYSDYDLGDIEIIDVSNPLKILLYYADFQTIVFLDNNLSEIERIKLNNEDFQDIRVLGLANDNHIWIYDDINSRLKKVSSENTILLDSDPLHLLIGKTIFVTKIVERNNTVYLLDPVNGIFIFDNLGNYQRNIGIKDIQDFQIMNDKVIYLKSDNQFYTYSYLDFKESKIEAIPKIKKGIKYHLSEKHLIVGKKDGVYFYEF